MASDVEPWILVNNSFRDVRILSIISPKLMLVAAGDPGG